MILANITGNTKIAGVIGDPISHSMSPSLHNGWLKKMKIDGVYKAQQVSADKLKEFFSQMKNDGWAGCNITIPHKEAALEFIDEIEETADEIGAVNTVVNQDGKLLGFNTDAYGFWQNLKNGVSDIENYKEKAVVVGAGGAARAVVYALKKAGVKEVVIVARNPDKAEELLDIDENMAIEHMDNLEEELENTSMLINTTPLGMKGKGSFDWPLDSLAKDALVTDIVYNPIETALLKKAARQENKTIDGLGMLIYQAMPGFEAWFGQRPDADITALKKEMIATWNL